MKLINILKEDQSYKVSYSGVILDSQSKSEILKHVNIPDSWKIINHHMTINLGELPENLKSRVNELVTLKITKIGQSDKALAVGVETDLSKNKIPHITVAINQAIGAKPKDSNDITEWKEIDPFTVKGYINEVLYQPPFKTNTEPTTLNVFDFDGTLMDSPTPENGKKLYKEITGNDWPYQGWWGRLESLTTFDVKPIPTMQKTYAEYVTIPNSINVLMTNRIPKFENVVKEKINDYYKSFDYFDFKNDNREKPDRIKEILKNNPSIKTINIFDDMDEQIEKFNVFKEQNPNLEINVFQVK